MIEEKVEQLLNENDILKETNEKTIEVQQEPIYLNGLNMGTVSLGDEAAASITGNAPNQFLNLVFPKTSYNDLKDKPSIPNKTSDLINDSNFTTSDYVDGLIGNINEILAMLTTISEAE